MQTHCPVHTTINLIDSKWKILILRDILQGPQRFGVLKRSITGVSSKMLSQSLREMEKDGLINRTVFSEMPPHVEYSLSELGNSMRPIIMAMES